jgi:hypothetical protein
MLNRPKTEIDRLRDKIEQLKIAQANSNQMWQCGNSGGAVPVGNSNLMWTSNTDGKAVLTWEPPKCNNYGGTFCNNTPDQARKAFIYNSNCSIEHLAIYDKWVAFMNGPIQPLKPDPNRKVTLMILTQDDVPRRAK